MIGPPQNLLLFCGEIVVRKNRVGRFPQTPREVRLKRRFDEQLIDSRFHVGYRLRLTALPPPGRDRNIPARSIIAAGGKVMMDRVKRLRIARSSAYYESEKDCR